MRQKTIPCIICADSKANEITKRILAGESLKALAEEYSFGRATMFRHRSRCLYAAKLVSRKRDKIARQVDSSILSRLETLSKRFDDSMCDAGRGGNMVLVGSFGRELRETLKSIHEIGKETQASDFRVAIVDSALPERCPACGERLRESDNIQL